MTYNHFKKISIVLSFGLLFLAGCMQSPSTKRDDGIVKKDSTNITDPSAPTFEHDKNYFQLAGTTTYNLDVQSDYFDYFFIRGKQIHQYLNFQQISRPICFVGYFPNSDSNKLLILSANIQKYAANNNELVLSLRPADISSSKAFCNQIGVINKLDSLYSGAGVAFSLTTLCPTCTASKLNTSELFLMMPDGNILNDSINLTGLSLKIIPSTNSGNNTTGCSANPSVCSPMYDCCGMQDVCVNAGTLQPNASLEENYDQAIAATTQNPASYVNFPNVYNVCKNVIPTPDDDNDDEQDDTATSEFLQRQDLYRCTTRIKGEMSICTVTYENVPSIIATDLFYTENDDRNFLTTYTGDSAHYDASIKALTGHSIYEVVHGNNILYQNREDPIGLSIIGGNDTLTNNTSITGITSSLTEDTINKDLKIRYMIDGSCRRISSSLAQCDKYYVQGQNIAEVDDHYPASNTFLLPQYANTSRSIKVSVNDSLKIQNKDWTLQAGGLSRIEFIGPDLKVYDGQEVKITFYVDTTLFPVLEKKEEADNIIKEKCKCVTNQECSLVPVYSPTIPDAITWYECKLGPNPNTQNEEEPITPFTLSNKRAPHRFFDDAGNYYSTPTQGQVQEGVMFLYEDSLKLQPNNLSQYVGFNEIYGQFNIDANSTKPAYEVRLKTNSTYDIYVRSDGRFTPCIDCGKDYHQKSLPLFPTISSERNPPGGYAPNPTATNKEAVEATYPYRGDDLLFGRACFVPVTMIPWTFYPESESDTQRRKRLSAQHFLFANGYQRDWYGFDYGAVIGSFDGVNWFAIGSKRRIKTGINTRLFLAINAPLLDLSSESHYSVTIMDGSLNPSPESMPQKDIDTDAAECQKYHICDKDSDCVAQLGWDYVCQNVSGIKTMRPKFDNTAQEEPETVTTNTIYSLIGASGNPTRCVYRGRGAPCMTTLDSSAANNYHGTGSIALNGCSSNNYCQSFKSGAAWNESFNTKIARYGRSIETLNATYDLLESTFGLHVKIPLRPYNYAGDEQIPSSIFDILNYNKVSAICIPGREPDGNLTIKEQHQTTPTDTQLGDKSNGIGMTKTANTLDAQYLSSCPTLDDTGSFFHLKSANINKNLNAADLVKLSASQNLTSNIFALFDSNTSIFDTDIIKPFNDGEQIESYTMQTNSCLRAPGATCFSDQDCTPTQNAASILGMIDPSDSAQTAILNKYELQFFKESMICSQKTPKTLIQNGVSIFNSNYELKNNKCCRETNKELTIPTMYENLFNSSTVPGVDIDLTDSERFSGVSTVYNELNNTSNYYPLKAAVIGGALVNLPDNTYTYQFKTFSLAAKKSCCSENWVRNFHDNNGGGHVWSSAKMQRISKASFNCLNWSICTGAQCPADPSDFNCAHVDDPQDSNCRAIATYPTDTEAQNVFYWMGKLELLGIPQIKVDDPITNSEYQCKVNPTDQSIVGTGIAIPDIISGATTREYLNGARELFSAADPSDFNIGGSTGMQMIFSDSKITCCIPAGDLLQEGENASRCCTGKTNSENRCVLPNYTNITVYFNRYVSSALQDLPDYLFDPETGYFLNDPTGSKVAQYAVAKKVCEENSVASGVVISSLKVAGHESKTYTISRYVTSASDQFGIPTLYDRGMRWNSHQYCVPQNYTGPTN